MPTPTGQSDGGSLRTFHSENFGFQDHSTPSAGGGAFFQAPLPFPGFSALWWSFEAKSSLRGAKKYSNIWLLNSGLSLNIECLVSQETPSQAGRESDDGRVLLKCSPMSSRLSQQTDPSTTNHNTSAATGSGSGSGAAPGLLDGPGPGPGPAVPMSCCPPV